MSLLVCLAVAVVRRATGGRRHCRRISADNGSRPSLSRSLCAGCIVMMMGRMDDAYDGDRTAECFIRLSLARNSSRLLSIRSQIRSLSDQTSDLRIRSRGFPFFIPGLGYTACRSHASLLRFLRTQNGTPFPLHRLKVLLPRVTVGAASRCAAPAAAAVCGNVCGRCPDQPLSSPLRAHREHRGHRRIGRPMV